MSFGLVISNIYKQIRLHLFMKNKRGISAVVTTILIVLLSLAAVLIVWGFVRGQITGAGEQIEIKSACLKLDLAPVSCTIATDNVGSPTGDVLANYRRGTGNPGLPVSELRLIFTLADGTTSVEPVTAAAEIPDQLETKTKSVTFSPTGLPDTLSVAGVLTTSTGDEALCDASPVVVNCN